jgi:CPA2 family monovalent cation:H+ antiporter-2/glutathione-regulated potassium-efflux system protein KefB
LLPLPATTHTVVAAEHGPGIGHLPGWVQTLAVLGAVGSIILAGRWIIVPLLGVVARTRLRELADREVDHTSGDHAWDSESMRDPRR